MKSLLVFQEPVHDRDRMSSTFSLVVSLDVELLVDDGHSLELLVPGLGAGAEVAAGHHHGLQQQPVLQLFPVETLLRLDRGQLGSVREEESQICSEDAMLHVA